MVAGNAAEKGRALIDTVPQMLANPGASPASVGGAPIPDMIVVGATDIDGIRAPLSQDADYLTTYAPGKLVRIPDNMGTYTWRDTGTSLASPQIAGLIAYWRALPSRWQTQLQQPANVKKLLRALHRPIAVPGRPIDALSRRIAWNGQVLDKNCLLDAPSANGNDWSQVCPTLEDNLAAQPDGPSADSCAYQPARVNHARGIHQHDAPNSCGWPGDSDAQSISFTPSSVAGPICTAGGCGTLCTGYYCAPHPTGTPPDFQDPKDPNNGNHHSTTLIGGDSQPSKTANPPLPPPPTTTTARPFPTPTNGRVVIVLSEEDDQTPGGRTFIRTWLVYNMPGDIHTKYDLCNMPTEDVLSTPADTPAAGVQFPPDLGPFVVQSSSCQYRGSEENLGGLICKGLGLVVCYASKTRKYRAIELVQVVICFY
ncbi:uncharacterized protein SPSK_09324 [Sporothrix schenckii 1099-18]|uniref:Peptidase S8/S53 domain-containing protein n=2 Tax=Sporothrix schenckii TaxID=29908 RepID=U7PXZ3_SPOS1|nr:uncharacterized protein SPSK_09324 [Sporothrix schenckii 1099-18]ERS99609.1 hypothetical protein HMPREF1624_02969 [Sporothrix schenckii ATCC 58251]KJR86048.1 hypothetical protein SPSK_09324 [Sporothrix schenckii 1099-18]